ncbi:CaiB/BaiF CoA transferase family protein [Thalassobacillus hwangdonensis]|uniref:CaiB/BaiF CoA transferase family protein n=1 Tax=Thalassobacillus hwangdonensis TaxID=546108 RepID=A0ABW3L542_9BACI
MLPLKGITVVSLEQAVAAPFATRQLADLGARVIKVEREDGDFARGYDQTVNGMSSHFVWLNRSKESIALDLKSEHGKQALDGLLAEADVFIYNLAPGAVDRLGFAASDLRKRHPRLIICGVSGYGADGPYTNKKAYDLLIQCEAGLVSVTGTEEEPSKSGISVADIAAGMYAYSGILTAIIARSQTGEGTVMEVSMLEALAEWMGYPMYFAEYGGEAPKRTGARHATIYPYGPFEASDGKMVFLAIQNEREWKQFTAKILGQPALADDPRFSSNSLRVENREALKAIIEGALAKLASDSLIDLLEEARIANARLNSVKDITGHPQLMARDRFREVDSPVGKLKALIPPVTFDGIDTVMNPIPEIGEHTDKILEEFGFSVKN